MRKVFTNFVSCLFLICVLIGGPLGVMATEEEAVFAGGCFWCLEHDLEDLPGVISAKSGYTGGKSVLPTYPDHKGHQEAVKVKFETENVSYSTLLRSYWRNIDPFNSDGQFCDRGDSYRPVIFVRDEIQEDEVANSFEAVSRELKVSSETIKVQVRKLEKFWPAEDYHQDFAIRNKLKYSIYRFNCGRDRRLDEIWGNAARTSIPWP